MMNYRKQLEIMVGSMELKVEDFASNKGSWQAFVFNQIQAWTSALIAKKSLTNHEALTEMFLVFEDLSVETPTSAYEHLVNWFYGCLGRMLSRL